MPDLLAAAVVHQAVAASGHPCGPRPRLPVYLPPTTHAYTGPPTHPAGWPTRYYIIPFHLPRRCRCVVECGVNKSVTLLLTLLYYAFMPFFIYAGRELWYTVHSAAHWCAAILPFLVMCQESPVRPLARSLACSGSASPTDGDASCNIYMFFLRGCCVYTDESISR